jgi:predicted MPP superfamily phosphohydrolase
MRTTTVIIFFSFFILTTGSISFYIFIRGLQSIPPNSNFRKAYIVIFWMIACSFISGRLFERFLPSFLATLLIWIGSFWIAAMLYFLMAVILIDLLRLANHFVSFFPAAIAHHYSRIKLITASTVLGLVSLLILAGYLNALAPQIKKLNLSVANKSSRIRSVNIVVASDIHLGIIVGRSRFDQIVNKINSLDPDLVLLLGDIVDEDVAPVIQHNLGEALRNIQSRYGVYAITGNHEYIGGVKQVCAYLTEHNIIMLRDQSIKVGDSFFLVGREDRSIERFLGQKRKGLDQIMVDVDKNYPVILMDHQPFGLNEAVLHGIDLQLSGHTHDGQLWPLNYIVESIYELAWGYRQIAGTHFYVSNGAGTWGPPVRIGNHPEIVNIRLNFE